MKVEKLLPTSGSRCVGVLVGSREVCEGVHLLDFRLESEEPPADLPVPGQFYQFDCGGGREHLLPRPLSVHQVVAPDRGEKVLRFLVEVAGWGTGRLCTTGTGERLRMLGPLGNGFDSKIKGRPLLLAGGVGVAPLYFLASEFDMEGREYDMAAGFRTAGDYYSRLSELDRDILVFTEDGEIGRRGMVSDCLGDILNDESVVYCCGPDEMMMVVSAACEDRGITCFVSLNASMACGAGICRGCVREGRSRNLCVCTEGPVFDSREVLWR
jgi:dihydroorotate dehydrogenase electron transfer subunit